MTTPENHARTSALQPDAPHGRRFSRVKPLLVVAFIVLALAVLLVVALGPRQKRNLQALESMRRSQDTPAVLVAKAAVAPARGELVLPGSIQAIAEAPIFARSEGYLRRRMADIGDRVRAEQLLAIVEAPEVDSQVRQAQATLSRAEATLAQTKASLEQSNTQLKLAEVTAQRWTTLFAKRVVSRQEVDEKQAAFEARKADNEAARANVAAATQAIAAAQAELQRLLELKGFQEIRAPFAGVITARNTDVGALIRSGASEGRELFRLAQIDTVRIMVQVPQPNVPAIRVGEAATVTVEERPNLRYAGRIARTANALDPATRTLLTEIHVRNQDNVLLPGMYAQVRLADAKSAPAITIPGETLVIRSDGPQVAVVLEDGKVHFQKLVLGRDYGAEIEVVSGLRGGESVVINPSDDVQEGGVVKPRLVEEAAPTQRPAK